MCSFPRVTPFISISLVILLGWDKAKVNTQGKNCIHTKGGKLFFVFCAGCG